MSATKWSILDVRYQQTAQALLQRAVRCGRLPHAYLFAGPDGVGRRMLASRFARLLMCESPQPVRLDDPVGPYGPAEEYAGELDGWIDGCGCCRQCDLLARDAHPDCHRVYRQLNKFHDDASVRQRKATQLGVDVIRRFAIEPAARMGTVGARKVFIIEEAELLSDSAQNCLLKTLEEPPEDTYFILLVTRLDALLPTTRSRCQLVHFRPLPPAFVCAHIKALCADLTEEAVHFLAHHEPGSLGQAVMLQDDGYFDYNTELVKDLLRLDRSNTIDMAKRINDRTVDLGKKLKARLPDSSDSDVQRRATRNVLDLVATFYRDVAHLAVGSSAGICNRAARAGLAQMAEMWGAERAADAVTHVSLAQRDIVANANGLLSLEALLIQLARLRPA